MGAGLAVVHDFPVRFGFLSHRFGAGAPLRVWGCGLGSWRTPGRGQVWVRVWTVGLAWARLVWCWFR